MRAIWLLAAVCLAVSACAPSAELTTADLATAGSGPTTSAVDESVSGVGGPGLAAHDSAPAPTTRSAGTAPTGSFVLGDSISLGVAPWLSRLGYPVVGRVGQSVTDDYLAVNLGSAAAQAAPAWVLVLGTNNPGGTADVAGIDGWLDLVDALRSPTAPQDVYWVTPYRDPAYTGALSGTSLDAFGAELVRQAGLRPWLHVIDFAAVADRHPEWFAADGAHLHPDDAGNGVLAALIAGPDAVPLLTPAPVSTLDGPGTVETGPAHPTTRPTTAPAPTVPAPTASATPPVAASAEHAPEPPPSAAPEQPAPAAPDAVPEVSPSG